MSEGRAIGFSWIRDARTDLLWYIGSAGAGWFYLALVWLLGRGLADPAKDPLWTWYVGSLALPVSLTVLVWWSWAYLLDGPHIWATLGRTLLDPDELESRGREIRRSFLWFLVGPALIIGPFLAAQLAHTVGASISRTVLLLGYHGFYLFFRLWAYYHVVRQHWGFFRLYKRQAGETDPVTERRDWWFFNASLYLPLLLFFTASWYPTLRSTYPDLGLHVPVAGARTLAEILRPLIWGAYAGFVLAYLAGVWRQYRSGVQLNGSKLLFLLSVAPLHLVVFSSPLLAVFVIPIVTVGHNIQYHRIIWDYARDKYFGGRGAAVKERRYRWPRRTFASWGIYAVAGFLFTIALFRGPWIEWLQTTLGLAINESVLLPLGGAAGVPLGQVPGVGEAVLASLFLGWSMQHYYLDAKIWRVSRDESLRQHLHLMENQEYSA